MNNIICPSCFGDGKETCNNPDHGFLEVIGFIKGNANEGACPVCGHDPDHKIKKWVNGKYVYNTCPTCNGSGNVTKEEYDAYLDEFVSEDNKDYIDEYCLNNKL